MLKNWCASVHRELRDRIYKTPTLRFDCQSLYKETRQGALWAEVFQFDAVASK